MRKIQVEVSEAVADFLHRKMETGEFADEGAVVLDALEGAIEEDLRIERWLREEVVPTLDRIDREPGRELSPQEVRAELERRRLARSAVD